MKRFFALFLSVLMAFGVLSAHAADYPIEEKFYRQMTESAYRATLSFSVSGNETKAMDPATFLTLKSLAPRISLEGDHSFMRGDGQASIRLMLDGQNVGETLYLYNETLQGLASDLLAGKQVFYTAAQGWDPEALFASLKDAAAWPALWPAFLMGQAAPNEWQARLQQALLPYETKLGIWMNGYAALSSGTEKNVSYTQLQCKIPVQAMKIQIKQMLIDFYGDQTLLSLLKEVLTPEQAAAYLHPSMQQAFFTMLDQLSMEGEIEILRRYDVMGNALLDSISLPFPADMPLNTLTISLMPQEAGQEWRFLGRCQDGTDFDISCIVGEEMIYTGSVSLVLPEKEPDSFVVEDTVGQRETVAFDYNLIWEPGEETYTLATDRCTRTIQGSLLIRPRENDNMPTQSLTLKIDFSSGSSQRAATQLNATLVWQDLDSEATITAALQSKTAAPFAVQALDQIGSSMRIDLMDEKTHSALLEYWGQRLGAWSEGLVQKLIPALSSLLPQS